MYKLIVAIALAVIGLTYYVSPPMAYAQILQECNVNDAGTGIRSYDVDTNDLYAQTFTASGSYSLGAIKFNLYTDGTPATGTTMIAYITQTTGATPAPDMNNILASQTFSLQDLPLLTTVPFPSTDNIFSCDPLVDPTQVITFSSPIALTGGTVYAIAFEFDSGNSDANMLKSVVKLADDGYAGGHAWDCLVPTSCSRNVPGDWDISNGVTDNGFAVFDNLVIVNPQGTADTWLDNFLSDFLGLDSQFGKLIFGSGFTLLMIIGLLYLKVHFIMTIAFGGFAMATAVLALLVPVEVFLAMFAIVGVGILIGGTILKGSSE